MFEAARLMRIEPLEAGHLLRLARHREAFLLVVGRFYIFLPEYRLIAIGTRFLINSLLCCVGI